MPSVFVLFMAGSRLLQNILTVCAHATLCVPRRAWKPATYLKHRKCVNSFFQPGSSHVCWLKDSRLAQSQSPLSEYHCRLNAGFHLCIGIELLLSICASSGRHEGVVVKFVYATTRGCEARRTIAWILRILHCGAFGLESCCC